MASRKLVVEIVGDSRDLERALGRSAKSAKKFGGDMDRAARRGRSAFGGLTKTIGLASAALGALGLAGAAKLAFTEMGEAQKVAAQTASVIKSTGGAAGVTVSQVSKLAESLMNLSGVDDELIQSAANVLLTFTEIRNEVGKGNDIYDQAAKAALNLSVRFDKDLASSAILVGKALNDPIKGLTALSRTGIQFSAAQKKQIKTMVENGRIMEAQKVILKELTTQTGGAAEALGNTLPGKLNILKENMLNLAGTIAARLSPQITDLAERATAWVTSTQNQQAVADAFQRAADAVGEIWDALGRVFERLEQLVAMVGGWKEAIIIATGLWVGFQLAATTSAAAIYIANVAAARGTAAAWRAALLATGWGALMVAAGLAATYIVTHWEQVKVWFQQFWIWLQETAWRTFQAILEPFSHLPGRMGEWARVAKDNVTRELQDLATQSATLGRAAGDNFGANFAGAVNEHLAIVQNTIDKTRKAAGAPKGPALPALTSRPPRIVQAGPAKTKTDGKKGPTAAEKRAAAQFAALGFGPTGEALVPGLPALRNVFGRISAAMKNASPKLQKQTKKLMDAIRKILSGGMGKVGEEVRRKMQQLLADLDKKLKGGDAKTRAQHFRKTNVEAILRSAGLTPEQIRLVSGRLAGSTGGRSPRGGQAAFGQRVGPGATVVNVGTVVTNDPDKFLRDMQKKASRTRAQQRGVRPGVALGGA